MPTWSHVFPSSTGSRFFFCHIPPCNIFPTKPSLQHLCYNKVPFIQHLPQYNTILTTQHLFYNNPHNNTIPTTFFSRKNYFEKSINTPNNTPKNTFNNTPNNTFNNTLITTFFYNTLSTTFFSQHLFGAPQSTSSLHHTIRNNPHNTLQQQFSPHSSYKTFTLTANSSYNIQTSTQCPSTLHPTHCPTTT